MESPSKEVWAGTASDHSPKASIKGRDRLPPASPPWAAIHMADTAVRAGKGRP